MGEWLFDLQKVPLGAPSGCLEFDRRVFDEQLGEDAVLEKMGYQQGKFSSGTTSEKRVF